jgi:predicted DNA-binding ribbon-helix-helix protein
MPLPRVFTPVCKNPIALPGHYVFEPTPRRGLTDAQEAILDQPRNVTIDGRRTSLRLAPEYWSALDQIGRLEQFPLHDLCTFIKHRHPQRSLASAVRVFVTGYFRELARAGDAPSPAGA